MGSGNGFLVTIAVLYFVPSVFAMLRGHVNAGAIFVLNLLLGWTLIGWVVALVWSVSHIPEQAAGEGRTPRGPLESDEWVAAVKDSASPECQGRIAELIEGETLKVSLDNTAYAEVVSEDGAIGRLDGPDAERLASHARRRKALSIRVHAIGGAERRKVAVRITARARSDE